MSLRGQPQRTLPPTRSLSPRVSGAASVGTNTQVAKLYLEIAQLFVAYGKPHVARRRLKFVIDQCGDSAEAIESRSLLEALDAHPIAGSSATSDRS